MSESGGDKGGDKGGGKGASSPDYGGSSGYDYGGNSGYNSGPGGFSYGGDYNVGGTDYAAGTGPLAFSGGGADSGVSSGGGFDWSTPSIGDFTSPDGSGFNLGGPGPVGGDMGFPGAGGGSNTPIAIGDVLSQGAATSDLGTGGGAVGASAPSAAGGGSATAFAAPTGVSGVPQLDALVSNPDVANANASVAPPTPGEDIWSSLIPAQQAATAGSFATDKPILDFSGGSSAGLPAAAPAVSSGGGVSSADAAKSGGGEKSVMEMLGIKPSLGTAAAVAGLANMLIAGRGDTDAVKNLQAQAAQGNQLARELIAKSGPISAKGGEFIQQGQDINTKGAALQQFIATGTLPDEYEAQVQQGLQAAKTKVIANAAARGMPTDPTKNSTLAQELAQIDNQAPILRSQIAKTLADTGSSIISSGNQTATTGANLSANGLVTAGVQAAGLSSNIYKQLVDIDNAKNTARGNAIANFAAALNGGTKGVTLKVA